MDEGFCPVERAIPLTTLACTCARARASVMPRRKSRSLCEPPCLGAAAMDQADMPQPGVGGHAIFHPVEEEEFARDVAALFELADARACAR